MFLEILLWSPIFWLAMYFDLVDTRVPRIPPVGHNLEPDILDLIKSRYDKFLRRFPPVLILELSQMHLDFLLRVLDAVDDEIFRRRVTLFPVMHQGDSLHHDRPGKVYDEGPCMPLHGETLLVVLEYCVWSHLVYTRQPEQV